MLGLTCPGVTLFSRLIPPPRLPAPHTCSQLVTVLGPAAEKGVMLAAEQGTNKSVRFCVIGVEEQKNPLSNTDQFEESPTDFALNTRAKEINTFVSSWALGVSQTRDAQQSHLATGKKDEDCGRTPLTTPLPPSSRPPSGLPPPPTSCFL